MQRNLTRLIYILGLALFFHTATVLAAVSARVDRTDIALGETLQLEVSVDDNKSRSTPRTDALEANFRILGSQQSSEVQIINGKKSSATRWLYTLTPLRDGTLTIPAIQVGSEQTQAISIQVMPRRQLGDGSNAPLWLQTELSKSQAWVQSEVVLTIRLFHSVEIADVPSFTFTLPEFIAKPHSEPVVWWHTEGATRYRVVEQKVSLFPQQSGTVTIPAFQAQINVASRSSRHSFFQNYEPHLLTSDPLELTVIPRPDSFAGTHWLPARQLKLVSSDAAAQAWRVGEPVTLTWQINAQGLTAEQLNDIDFVWPDTVRAYQEAAVRTDAIRNGEIYANWSQKIALIPAKSGIITIPEVKIAWWNVETERTEYATIPATSVNVLPSIEQNDSRPLAVVSADAVGADAVGADVASSESDNANADLSVAGAAPQEPPSLWAFNGWFWVSVGLVVAWLLTIVVAVAVKINYGSSKDQQVNSSGHTAVKAGECKKLASQLKKAAQENQASAARALFYHFLTITAQATVEVRNEQLLVQECPASVVVAVGELDRYLYGPPGAGWDGEQFWLQIEDWVKAQCVVVATEKPAANELPELYPSR